MICNNLLKSKSIKFFTAILVLAAPLVASAQSSFGAIDIISTLRNVIAATIPLVITLGLLVFLWGLLRYISKAGNENAMEEGRRLMLWGIITLFVMVSVWGLVGIINTATGIPQGGGIRIPQLP